ncbi:LAGLIDADG family homing endonuclease [Ammoniphilus resinae]|nr:LAGLIDADG family homing endonuclease [Ammoniphilus resinae]
MEGVNQNVRRRHYGARGREELLQEVCKLYEQGHSQHEIANMLSVPRGTLSRWMMENNIKGRDPGEAGKEKSRIYHYDENYFSVIETYNKAYLVGFILGDGCIHDRVKSKRLVITLAKEDMQLVKDIAHELNMVEAVKIDKNRRRTNEQEKVRLSINSTKMCDDLIKLGITPKKTKKEQWIEFNDDKLQWAFLRGIFDADGHIRVYPRNGYIKARFGLTGTYELLNGTLQFLKRQGFAKRVNSITPKEGCYDLYLSSVDELKAIYEHLYAFGDLKLTRKHEKFYSLMI